MKWGEMRKSGEMAYLIRGAQLTGVGEEEEELPAIAACPVLADSRKKGAHSLCLHHTDRHARSETRLATFIPGVG